MKRELSSKWLHALPIDSLQLHFSSTEYKLALRWWLGMAVFLPNTQCPEISHAKRRLDGSCEEPKQCSHNLDPAGDHAVGCHVGPSLIARHDHVKLFWKKLIELHGWKCTLEPKIDESRFRPADVLVNYWSNLRDGAHDWVIVHPLSDSALNELRTGLANLDPHNPLSYAEADPNHAILRAEHKTRQSGGTLQS